MKIIVIGLGQLGQELVKELIQKNHDVTVIDLNKELLNKTEISCHNRQEIFCTVNYTSVE